MTRESLRLCGKARNCGGAACSSPCSVPVLLQVFTRYVVNRPFGWTSEACVIFYVWIVFWTRAFLLRERDHVTFTMVYERRRPPAGASWR